jgi:hypothetical protein
MVTFDFRQTAPWLGMGPVIDTENSADARAKLRALMIFVDFPNCRASDAEAPYNGTAYYREILADDGLRVMNALIARGVQIPAQVQIGSLYDNDLLEQCQPQVSALQFDAAELGRVACRELLRFLLGEEYEAKPVLDYRIILREST